MDQVKQILSASGFAIRNESPLSNNHGTRINLENGAIVNVFDTGKISIQGKNADLVKPCFSGDVSDSTPSNRKVFVVYGHDMTARTQLEAMLRRWGFEPLILDQLASSGQTIIEKLEEYIGQASVGIVLATPDDCGYAKGKEVDVKHRVRQNVVLELGILLAKLGREKVAILLSQAEDMEQPSDIQGLIYIPFKDNVEETGKSLSKEVIKWGYTVDVAVL